MFNHPRILGYCFLLIFALNNANIAVRVAVGGTFHLLLNPNSLDNPVNCTLLFSRTTTVIIPPHDTQIENGRIVPLGSDLCGVRVHNVISSDSGVWTLTSSSATTSVSQSYRVTLVSLDVPENTTSTADVGDTSLTLTCGPRSMLYCDLKDPLGNDAPLSATARCSTIIQVVKPTDFGVWTCTVGISGSMEEIYATHTLEMGDPWEEVVIFANETPFGNLITWQGQTSAGTATWCRAFPPNGETILVASGLEVGKYMSVGTDYSINRCGILIKDEFPEEYKGLWRLEIRISGRRTSGTIGGFIVMPEGTRPRPNDPRTATQNLTSLEKKEIKVATGQSFAITCQTQYSAGYCWIQGPQGQIDTSTDELTVGRCSYTISRAVLAEHNGTWKCNMAHVNGGQEEHLETEVIVIDKLYQAVNPEIKVRQGHKTVVACRSVFDYPLRYCRFIRPDGVGLGVTPGMDITGRYSYEGPGLDYGYCGLAISSVETVDIGNWTCVSRLRFGTVDAENFDTFVLEVFEMTTGSVFQMLIRIPVLVLFLTVVLVLAYNNKRLRNEQSIAMVEPKPTTAA